MDVVLSPILKVFIPDLVTPLQWLGQYTLEVAKGNWPEETLFKNVQLREFGKASKAST